MRDIIECKCGNRYPSNTKFCSGCGVVLATDEEKKALADSVRPISNYINPNPIIYKLNDTPTELEFTEMFNEWRNKPHYIPIFPANNKDSSDIIFTEFGYTAGLGFPNNVYENAIDLINRLELEYPMLKEVSI